MQPLVLDFLGGSSRLLVAMGPTGSGKTHTVFGSPDKPGLVPLALRELFRHSRYGEHFLFCSTFFCPLLKLSNQKMLPRN